MDQVKEATAAYTEPVIIVGHSLGGAVITQVAAQIPQQISKPLYVAGFVPQSGKSVQDYAQMDAGSQLGPKLRLSDDQLLVGLADPKADLADVFAQDATHAQKPMLLELNKSEPTIPLGTPLNYKPADYQAAGKKDYIHTTADRKISYSFQQQMAAVARISNIRQINFRFCESGSAFLRNSFFLFFLSDSRLTDNLLLCR